MNGTELLLDVARRYARAQAEERRQLEDEGWKCRKIRDEVVVAAVDTVEFLEAVLSGMDPGSSAHDEISNLIAASRDRLELAGVQLDGAVGELFDISKHHGIARVESNKVPANHVLTVVNYGITCNGERIRSARVTVATGDRK